jgi:hypothetical protein
MKKLSQLSLERIEKLRSRSIHHELRPDGELWLLGVNKHGYWVICCGNDHSQVFEQLKARGVDPDNPGIGWYTG